MSAQEFAIVAGAFAALIGLRGAAGLALRAGLFDTVGRHRRGLGVAASCVLVALFATLAAQSVHAPTPATLDRWADAALEPLRHPGPVSVFAWITEFGSIPTLAAVTVVATAFLAVLGPRRDLIPVWVAIIGNEASTWTAKFLIDRPRPDFALDVTAHSPSFPSGHASGALAIYGVLAYVLARRMKSPRSRLELVYWTGVAVVAIAFSRVFVDVHHLTDIAGGLALAGIWLMVAAAADRAGAQN